MKILYIPIGTKTYDLEKATIFFESSKKLLKHLSHTISIPSEILFSVVDIENWISNKNPDLVILQNITFANAELAIAGVTNFNCPLLLWTLREPLPSSLGGRLCLNSLTGAFSAGNALNALHKDNFEYIFGSPDEELIHIQIKATIEAAKVKKELSKLTIAAIGHTPQGFGFGRALDAEMRNTFGCKLISIEARELIKKAETISDSDIKTIADDLKEHCLSWEKIPTENLKAHYKLQKAYNTFVTEYNIGALASRCWPDFFTEYKTPVCTVLSMLNEMGIPATGEADVYGALTMFIASKLSLSSAFFGDPVAMDEKNNTITYWHCGMAAPKLARIDTKATLGVHPNRKIGPVMDFGCYPAQKATVIRIGRTRDAKFRMYICKGEVLDAPKQYQGTSVVFKPDNTAIEIIAKAIHQGWEPHFIVAFCDIQSQVEILSRMLGIEVCNF